MRFGLITLLIVLALLGALQPDTYYVTTSGRGDFVYRTLEGAIAAAKPGSTIEVKPGVYTVNVVIEKPLWIRAGGEAPVIIRAADPGLPVLKVLADNVRISGLTLEGGAVGIAVEGRNCRLRENTIRRSKVGVLLQGAQAQGCLIRGNIIAEVETGIALQGAAGNTLAANEVAANRGIVLDNADGNLLVENHLSGGETGFLLTHAEQNELKANLVEGSEVGLIFDHAPGNFLHENSFSGNQELLRVVGEEVDNWVQRFEGNTVDGRAIYYLVEAEDLALDATANVGYVVLVRCRGVALTGLNLQRAGIAVIASEGVTIRGVRISGAERAIYLWKTHNSLIEASTINGARFGIVLRESSADIVSGNQVEGSEVGLLVEGGGGHLLEGNEVRASAQHGIALHSSNNNKLRGNTVSDSGQYGILVENSQQNLLEGNSVAGSWVGIFLQGATANELQGNEVRENNYGIYLANSKGNHLAGNILEDNSRADLGGALEGNKVEVE